MISIAVVEDEEPAAKTLINCLNKYAEQNGKNFSVTRFDDAVIFLEGYKANYDIVFMDVLLPKMNGMDAAKRLREIDKNTILIFVTNMAKFAVKSYEVDALDFIVKPVAYSSFVTKMDKVVKAAERERGKNILISSEGKVKVISTSAVSFVEVMNHDLIYHTDGEVIRVRGSLSAVEKYFTDECFFRCSVCCIINMKYVTEVDGNDVTVGGEVVRVSRSKKKEFMNALTNFFGRSV